MNANRKPRSSARVERFPSNRMLALAASARQMKQEGKEVVDLALGAPDYAAPEFLTEAAIQAIRSGQNGYGDPVGSPGLRRAVADHFNSRQNTSFSHAEEVTVTCGASAALEATLLALVNPGEQVLVPEPFFEGFAPQIILAGAHPRYVPMQAGDWTFQARALKKNAGKRARAILINSPNNPTGRVLSLDELHQLADFCLAHDLLAICDEAYEPFVYSGLHLSLASLPSMRDRCVVVNSVAKSFNVAGWRVGTIIAGASLSGPIRKVASSLSLGAPVPLQEACIEAYRNWDAFAAGLADSHLPLRDRLGEALLAAGFGVQLPQGGQFIYADAAPLGMKNSEECCRYLLDDLGLLAVPGNCFTRPGAKTSYVRFCFARKPETIEQAADLLGTLKR